jgi:hypothetical protein
MQRGFSSQPPALTSGGPVPTSIREFGHYSRCAVFDGRYSHIRKVRCRKKEHRLRG